MFNKLIVLSNRNSSFYHHLTFIEDTTTVVASSDRNTIISSLDEIYQVGIHYFYYEHKINLLINVR